MDRIFAKSTLREFWEKNPDSEQYLKTWYEAAKSYNWKSPNEVKNTYANASILKDSRIVFNINGNSYISFLKQLFIYHIRDYFIHFRYKVI